MELIVLAIFSYALYRLAVSHNIMPWKWIVRYVMTFFASTIVAAFILAAVYGQKLVEDSEMMVKLAKNIAPFVFLYQFVLFFFFRLRIVRYVHNLDQMEKINNPTPPQPAAPKKDDQDFSYFR